MYSEKQRKNAFVSWHEHAPHTTKCEAVRGAKLCAVRSYARVLYRHLHWSVGSGKVVATCSSEPRVLHAKGAAIVRQGRYCDYRGPFTADGKRAQSVAPTKNVRTPHSDLLTDGKSPNRLP